MTNDKARTPCEVYSRVCGYLRPVSQWNDAKQEEYKHRVVFKNYEVCKPQQNKDGKEDKREEEGQGV